MSAQGTRLRQYWSKVNKTTSECWEWTGTKNRDGYGQFGRGVFLPKLAHRAAWVLTYGPIPEGMCVLHRCDNPGCVNPSHLWLGTHADNVADRHKKCRTRVLRGEEQWMSKLTEDRVREIIASDNRGVDLARRFGVSQATISMIRTKRRWRHIHHA